MNLKRTSYLNSVLFTSLNHVLRILPHGHWERARSSALDNFKYCIKQGQFEKVGDFTVEETQLAKSSEKVPVSKLIRGLMNKNTMWQV